MNKQDSILIIGLGLIGGSYAKKLKENGYKVSAITKNEEDIEYAIKNNIIDDGVTDVNKEYIQKFKYVIFALYPKVLLSWVKEYGSYFAKGTYISDVTGIKSKIVYQIQELLPQDVEFIGAHPMAGREVYGVRNAKSDLFKSANYIITPTEKNTEKGVEFARKIGEELEFKRISLLSPETHDEMIAFLSQLTHCIAVSLMACKDSTHLSEYTGDSFRDLTRIANINEDMWSELFMMNKDKLLQEMDIFAKEFNSLKTAIENEDVGEIKNKMRLSTKRRSYFDK